MLVLYGRLIYTTPILPKGNRKARLIYDKDKGLLLELILPKGNRKLNPWIPGYQVSKMMDTPKRE